MLNYLADRLGKDELNGLIRTMRAIFRHRILVTLLLTTNIVMAFFEGGSIVVLSAAVAVLTQTDTGISGKVLNWVVEGSQYFRGPDDTGTLFLILVGIAILMQVLRSGLYYGSAVANANLSAVVWRDLSQEATNRVMSLSYESLGKYPAGEIAGLVEQSGILWTLIREINKTVIALVMIVTYISLIIMTSPVSSLIMILSVIILWISIGGMLKKLRAMATREVDAELDVWRNTVEFLNAPRLLRIFNATKLAGDKINAARTKKIFAAKEGNVTQAVLEPLVEVFVIVGIGLMIIGAYFYFGDSASEQIPVWFVYALVILRTKPQIIALSQVRLKIFRMLPRIGVLEQLLSIEGKTLLRTDGVSMNTFLERFSFDGVSFKYPGASEDVLRGVSFDIHKGKTVALVGSSGAGKSTVLDLLLGLYEPTSGTIVVDGLDLNEIDLQDWREQIGVVEQDSFLLNASIRENIEFARSCVSFREIENAARLANAHQFIEQTKDGYDTVIGDRGNRLSGGQVQRLVMARALLRDPDILLLDEATSALDVESERLIQSTINSMHNKRTILVIAHRFSTIANSDWILVLENGEIAEQGTMDQLVSKEGYFKRYLLAQNEQEGKLL